MRCDTALERMLEVELDELRGTGDSPVAVHVRECGRCRTVAEQLLADTRALAVAVEAVTQGATVSWPPRAGGRRRVPHGRYLIAGSLAAAALAFLMVRRGPDHQVRPVVQPAPVHVTRPSSASAPGSSSVSPHAGMLPVTPSRPAAPARGRMVDAGTRSSVPRSSSPSLTRSAPHRFPPAQSVSATPISPRAEPGSREGAARGVVSVEPPRGKRVAVVRTPDPAVTVVWLY